MNFIITSVLFDEIKFDKEKLLKDFSSEWNIAFTEEEEESNNTEENFSNFILSIEDIFITISFFPIPIPNNEVEENAYTSVWSKATEVAKNYKAHLLITVLSMEKSTEDLSSISTKIVSSALLQENATGVYSLGTIYQPDYYREMTYYYDQTQIFPTILMVYVGIYSDDNGKTVNAYTYGLQHFNKQEIEILNSNKSPEEVYAFLMDVSNYVISNDVLLEDGETIGFSAEEKLGITVSKGIVVENDSIKIDF